MSHLKKKIKYISRCKFLHVFVIIVLHVDPSTISNIDLLKEMIISEMN